MKRTFILTVAILLSMAPLAADEYNYLTVTSTSSEQSISLPTIQKITFSEGNALVATTDGQTYTYPLSELQKMSFTATATAIKALPSKADKLSYKGNTLRINGTGILHIYNAAGVLVQMAHVKDGANINLGTLPKGIYVVNMGEQTIKIKK